VKKNPKVGDRIRVKKSLKGFMSGKTGTVAYVLDDSDPLYELPIYVSFQTSDGGAVTIPYKRQELKRA
jgi:hypothetical protein